MQHHETTMQTTDKSTVLSNNITAQTIILLYDIYNIFMLLLLKPSVLHLQTKSVACIK